MVSTWGTATSRLSRQRGECREVCKGGIAPASGAPMTSCSPASRSSLARAMARTRSMSTCSEALLMCATEAESASEAAAVPTATPGRVVSSSRPANADTAGYNNMPPVLTPAAHSAPGWDCASDAADSAAARSGDVWRASFSRRDAWRALASAARDSAAPAAVTADSTAGGRWSFLATTSAAELRPAVALLLLPVLVLLDSLKSRRHLGAVQSAGSVHAGPTCMRACAAHPCTCWGQHYGVPGEKQQLCSAHMHKIWSLL